jgi:hypothetical protein
VRENFVACDVLSQLQRVMENPRFLLAGECEPLRAGDQVRIYATANGRTRRLIEMSASDLATRAISANRAK